MVTTLLVVYNLPNTLKAWTLAVSRAEADRIDIDQWQQRPSEDRQRGLPRLSTEATAL